MSLPDISKRPPDFDVEAVFLDLDGTCLDMQQHLHRRTEDAIKAAADRAPVILASGRMYRSALKWSHRLGLKTPLLCYQGALIREVGDGATTLLLDALPQEAALAAVALARENGWHRQLFVNDELYCEEDRPEGHLYARIADVPINFVDNLETRIGGGMTKVVYVSEDREVVTEALVRARAAVGNTARVTTSLPQLVEIVSATAGKGRAAHVLCAERGWDISRVVAVGDAPNDVDMLEAVGFGVAVRPVNAALAPHASATCAPPQEGGVADVLRACGLLAA